MFWSYIRLWGAKGKVCVFFLTRLGPHQGFQLWVAFPWGQKVFCTPPPQGPVAREFSRSGVDRS